VVATDLHGQQVTQDVGAIGSSSITDSVGGGILVTATTGVLQTINADIINTLDNNLGIIQPTDGANIIVNGQAKNTGNGSSASQAGAIYVSNTSTSCKFVINATGGRVALLNTGTTSDFDTINNNYGEALALVVVGNQNAKSLRPNVTINGDCQNDGAYSTPAVFAGCDAVINGKCVNSTGATSGSALLFGTHQINSGIAGTVRVTGECINNANNGFPFRCGGTPASDSTQIGSWADGVVILGGWRNNDAGGGRITVRGQSCLYGYLHNNANCLLAVTGTVSSTTGPAVLIESNSLGTNLYTAPILLLGTVTGNTYLDINSSIIAAAGAFVGGLTVGGPGTLWVCVGGNPAPKSTARSAGIAFTVVVPGVVIRDPYPPESESILYAYGDAPLQGQGWLFEAAN
jgi:hypothetical protein